MESKLSSFDAFEAGFGTTDDAKLGCAGNGICNGIFDDDCDDAFLNMENSDFDKSFIFGVAGVDVFGRDRPNSCCRGKVD